jgi:glucosamine-phosphate N-acetyltransferase
MYFRILSKNDYLPYIKLVNEFRSCKLQKEEFNTIYTEVFQKGQVWLLIDESTKKIIGTGTILFEQKFINNGGIVAHIEDVIISKEEKGKGYGTYLLEYLINKSREKKCYKIILNCSPELAKFYKKLGFSQKNFQMELRDS